MKSALQVDKEEVWALSSALGTAAVFTREDPMVAQRHEWSAPLCDSHWVLQLAE